MTNPDFTLLLVEDNPGDAQLIQAMLAGVPHVPCRLVRATTLAAAQQVLSTQTPDAVLLDLTLPDSQGLATLSALQAAAPGTPVLVLTGQDDNAQGMAAVSQGAQDYLVKGEIDGCFLTRTIGYAIERQRLLVELEQHQHEQQASEKRFRSLITAIVDAVFVVDQGGIVRFVNPAAVELTGHSVGDLLGHEFGFPIGSEKTTELTILRPDGNRIAEMRVVRIEWAGDEAWLASLRDITQRKRITEALTISEAKLRSFVDQSADGIVLVNQAGQIVEWNAAQETITGLSRVDAIGQAIWDVQYWLAPVEKQVPEHLAAIKAQIMQALETGEMAWANPVSGQPFRRTDGEARILQSQVFPIQLDNGIGLGSISRDVTEQKQVEQALHDSHQFLTSVLDALSAHVAILDDTGTLVDVNAAWRRFADANGLTVRNYGIGVNYLALCDAATGDWSEGAHEMAAGIRAVLAGEQDTFSLEYPCHSPDERRWFVVWVTRFTQNDAARVVVAHENITERKETERVLADERNLLRALMDTLPDYVYAKDAQARFTLLNVAGARLMQVDSPDNMIGKTDFDVFPAHLAEQYFADDMAVIQSGQPLINREEPNVDAEGNERWFLTTKVPLRDSQGQIIGLVGTGRDIADRKETERILADERNLLRTLIDNLPHYVYAKDTQARITLFNAPGARMMGAKMPDDVIGKTDFDLFPANLAEQYFADDMAVIQSGQPLINREEPNVDAEGNEFWLLTTKVPLRDSQGQIIGLVGTGRDISDRKETERILADERNLLRTLIDNLPDYVYAKDTHGRNTLRNVASARLTGAASPEEMIGKTDFDYYPEELAARYFVDDMTVIQSGQPLINREEPNIDAEGNQHWLLTTKIPLRDTYGDIVGLVGIGRDITERKLAQEALNKRTQEISLLYEAGKQLGHTLDLEGTYDNLYDIVCGVMACDMLLISSYDAETDLVRCVYLRYQGERPAQTRMPPVPLNTEGGFHSGVIRSGEAMLIADYRTTTQQNRSTPGDGGASPSGQEETIQSALIVPLRHQHQTIGVIQVGSYQSGTYSEDDLRFLKALTPQFAAATINAQLYFQAQIEIAERTRAEEAERNQRALAEALAAVAAVVNSELDMEAVMGRILENVGQVVPHDASNILLVDNGMVQAAYWRGYPAEMDDFFKTFSFRLADTPNLNQMYQTHQPFAIPHTSNYEGWVHRPELAWVRSQAGAPMVVHEQVIGFISVDSRTPGFFTPTHAEHLQAFADQAAIAIDNARLYQAVHSYATDLEERVVERTAQLHRAADRVETILNNSSDSILVARASGAAIDQANPAFNEQFDYQEIEIVGKPLSLLAGANSGPTLADALERLAATGEPQRIEIMARRKDGTEFDADMALAPIVGGNDTITHLVCSLRDISARKALEANLREALAHEKELSELKSRFVSMVSHEFRTPLATIQSSTGLLKDYADRLTDQKKNQHLDKIQTQVRRLTNLLDDILTISKMQSVGLDFNPAPLDLLALCQEAADEFQMTAGPGVTIAFLHSGTCKPAIMDEKLVRHVVNNLLSNAVKYSPRGGTVTFEVRCDEVDAVLRIQDQGIGIPKSEQHRLFEPFYRASNVGTIKGTGLGLSIMHSAVVLHNGRVELESGEGMGTTFTVWLPLTPPEETGYGDNTGN